MSWVSFFRRLPCTAPACMRYLLFNSNLKCTQHRWSSSWTGTPTNGARTTGAGFSLNADGYVRFQAYTARENAKALDMVSFKHGPDSTKQHLEIGCGPGDSTKSVVLGHCSPCSRLVATDKATDMIEAARRTSSHPSIHYDVLDVEAGDVAGFVKKYGQFDRVYSLLNWHYLGDQLKGYRNLRHLMKDGGECLVSACIESMFLNAWLDVFLTGKWGPFVPDPRQIFSNLTYFDCGKPHSVLASEVRKLVTDAGLRCNDCQLYESRWDFADIEETLDFVFMFFDSTARIPPKDLDEFRNAWRDRLLKKQAQSPKGFGLKFLFYVVHASK